MKYTETLYLIILDSILLLLMLEYHALQLEAARPLAIVWGIGTLLFNIVIIVKQAIYSR